MGIKRFARRTFLGIATIAAGGVAFGYWQYSREHDNPLEGDLAEGEATFNPWIKIAADNTITVITPRAEMGQGVHTTLAALVAEELNTDLADLVTEHGPPAPAYYNAAVLKEGAPFATFDDRFIANAQRGVMGAAGKIMGFQITGGSTSIIDAFDRMREAGAAARAVLLEAAAQRWGVEATSLVAEGGRITNPLTDESLTFGALAAEAAAMEVPGSARPRPREQWRILGRSQPRVDLMAKVTGAPVYGIDVDLPDMAYATVKMSPRFGASALSVDTAPALAVPGVREIVPIETTTGSGFGIIADNTWAAFRGADALDVEWGAADYPENDEGIRRRLVEAVQADPSHALIDRGDVDTALSEAPADEIVEAEYSVPYLAHATLEPMNATARFADGRLEIWTGSQAPGIVQSTCASLLGIDADAVTVNVTFLGGGFGRRGEVDFPLYAAALARHLEGRPVKVTWSREEDTRHDTYRPAALGRFRAHVPAGEAARAVEMRIAAPSIIRSMLARTYPSIPPAGPDKTITDGAFNQPVATPHFRVSGHEADITIPVGFWRAVGNSYNGWFHESFMDEMAEKAGMDPLDYRLATMGDDPRFDPARGVLRRVAEMSGWGGSLPSGMGRGIAHVLSFGTWTAMVVEVDSRGGEINLTRCWIAADPGEVLDPRNFTDQLTGAAIFGFSSAIEGLHFEDGMVVEGNFWDYPFLTMAQAPRFEVSLLESAPHMGGAGEVGTPPAVPALANAIFAATGQRLRAMPFSDHVTFAV